MCKLSLFSDRDPGADVRWQWSLQLSALSAAHRSPLDLATSSDPRSTPRLASSILPGVAPLSATTSCHFLLRLLHGFLLHPQSTYLSLHGNCWLACTFEPRDATPLATRWLSTGVCGWAPWRHPSRYTRTVRWRARLSPVPPPPMLCGVPWGRKYHTSHGLLWYDRRLLGHTPTFWFLVSYIYNFCFTLMYQDSTMLR